MSTASKWSLCVLIAATGAANAGEFLTHHVRDAAQTGTAKESGELPKGQLLNLDIVLPVRDQAGLDAFVASVSDPESGEYRQYVTPAEFTTRFGPSAADYATVLKFAQAHGLTVTGGSHDAMDVQVRGTVAAVEAAFNVHLLAFQDATQGRTFFAPDREPTTDLSIPLWHVSGLDNYSIPHPLFVSRDDPANLAEQPATTDATTGSGPSNSFLGSDMRAAYAGGTALTGAGQVLGLFEYLGTDLADLKTYYTNVNQPYPSNIVLLSTDGTSTSCTGRCDDTEQTLDMTQALGMAPGATQLTMYVGSLDTAIIGAMTVSTPTTPLPGTIGCSWGWTPADPTTLDPYFEKMAAQGQTFFAASGDKSTWSKLNEAWPADDAYVVSVGGTDLVTASAAGPWKSETAWVHSGGGISPDKIAIPSWQVKAINATNKGSTTLRNGPDVSANANYTFYTCADQKACAANKYGGTSFAAPMWAGYIALVNQQLAANHSAPVGFLDPTIYAANAKALSYAKDFHDILSGKSGSFSAVKGYDLVTGWGSPKPALITSLAP